MNKYEKEISAWYSVIDWTEDVHKCLNISYERISYLWAKYNVVQFMLHFWELYQTHDMWVNDVKVYIESQGGSIYA